MDDRNLIVVLIFLTLITIALIIGVDITGNAVSYSYESCNIDSDCRMPEVCCLFYGKSEGVCDLINFCPSIEEMTRENELNEGILLTQAPKKDARYYVQNSLISLLFILLVLLIALIIVARKRRKKLVSKISKSTKKKTRKKSRKRR